MDRIHKKSSFPFVAGIVVVLLILCVAFYGFLAFSADNAYGAKDYNLAEARYRILVALNPWAGLAYAHLGFIELRKNDDITIALKNNLPLTRISTFYKSALLSERALALGLVEGWVYQNAALAYDNLYVRASRDLSPSPIKEKVEKLKESYKVKAIFYYEKALILAPIGALLDNLGSIYYQEKDYKRAIPYLEQAAKLDKTNGRLRVLLGFIYVNTGDPARALQYFDEAIALNYKNYFSPAMVHVWKGRAHFALKEYGSAIVELSKGLTLDPSISHAYFWRASSYMAKKQTSKAEQDLETYLRLYPAGFYASDAKNMLKNIK